MKLKNAIIAALALTVLLSSCRADKGGGDGDTGSKDYVFYSGEVSVAVGDSVEDALRALGEYKSYYTSPSCASEGEDVMYVYDGFRITASLCRDKSIIYIIELTNDTVSTPEGISVGDARDEVVSAYGYGYRSVGESLEYRADNCILQFIVRDGRVSSIKYIASDK